MPLRCKITICDPPIWAGPRLYQILDTHILIWRLVKLCAIASCLFIQGSTGYNISPTPSTFPPISSIEGRPGVVHRGKSLRSNAPSPSLQINGPALHPPLVLPPIKSAPAPEMTKGYVPSMPPSNPRMSPPHYKTPPHLKVPITLPSVPPSASQRKAPDNKAPVWAPVAPIAPVAPVPDGPPQRKWPQNPPSMHPHPVMPGLLPPSAHNRNKPDNKAPISTPIAPDPDVTPISTPPLASHWRRKQMPVAAPPNRTPDPLSPVNHSPAKAPSIHNAMRHSNAPASLSTPQSPTNKGSQSPASSPSMSFSKHHRGRNKITGPAPASSYLIPPPSPRHQGPVISPAPSHPPKSLPNRTRTHHAPLPLNPGSRISPAHSPSPSSLTYPSPAPSPSPTARSGQTMIPFLSPKISPSRLPPSSKMPAPPPVQALPPPPPNQDCSAIVCTEPNTNTPPGSPCGCVLPMQVQLRLNVALYTFFPLVSELAEEIAAGVFMRQSQVRIMGANAASPEAEKTIVLIDLVPLGEKFDNTTAFLTYQRFWGKQVVIKNLFFGDYEVIYVNYPGLPPSPPSAPSSITMIDNGPYSGQGNNGRTIHPLGVDVHKNRHKHGLSGSVIAIIVLSASVAVVLCSAVAWVFLFKKTDCIGQPVPTQAALVPSLARPPGAAGSVVGSAPSSASLSFGSSIATYTGSAKTFSAADIERATDNFDDSRILGEGGFGRVYSGVLEDGTKVAVKVLKRDDHQGGREFLAEVEMLSRLHHRNLVKLIGICTEERTRCLVYELIPNGSVESHLHGADKETAPLDWGARIKVALGAARGLAYLHEDSSPRVIHRDFKSSNILLEHDFTPKVSDFGLARTAMDEENRHISTRVMGTFGYVAPEYAMTGHLLENLVAWARPLLTSKEGLQTMIDLSLGSDVPFDSVAKVAAIASMCVQPEVSHRPFMGEVVQALKLVCNECDETKEAGQLPDPSHAHFPVSTYGSGLDAETGLSVSELFSTSARFGRQPSGSFRRYSSSGPLRTGRARHFWQRMRRNSGGSVSEHGIMFRLRPGSH
ncbi:unnamed protein product, partial [Vitis vinifera]